ncbi:MAG: hypothetical protein AAFO07_22025, partial [Bacteroidota bacterium]
DLLDLGNTFPGHLMSYVGNGYLLKRKEQNDIILNIIDQKARRSKGISANTKDDLQDLLNAYTKQ